MITLKCLNIAIFSFKSFLSVRDSVSDSVSLVCADSKSYRMLLNIDFRGRSTALLPSQLWSDFVFVDMSVEDFDAHYFM